MAIKAGDAEIVQLLVDHGARVDAVGAKRLPAGEMIQRAFGDKVRMPSNSTLLSSETGGSSSEKPSRLMAEQENSQTPRCSLEFEEGQFSPGKLEFKQGLLIEGPASKLGPRPDGCLPKKAFGESEAELVRVKRAVEMAEMVRSPEGQGFGVARRIFEEENPSQGTFCKRG